MMLERLQNAEPLLSFIYMQISGRVFYSFACDVSNQSALRVAFSDNFIIKSNFSLVNFMCSQINRIARVRSTVTVPSNV